MTTFDDLIDDVLGCVIANLDAASLYAVTHSTRRLRSLTRQRPYDVQTMDLAVCDAATRNYADILTWIRRSIARPSLFSYRAVFVGCLLGGHSGLFTNYFTAKDILGDSSSCVIIINDHIYNESPIIFDALVVSPAEIGHWLAHAANMNCLYTIFMQTNVLDADPANPKNQNFNRIIRTIMIEQSDWHRLLLHQDIDETWSTLLSQTVRYIITTNLHTWGDYWNDDLFESDDFIDPEFALAFIRARHPRARLTTRQQAWFKQYLQSLSDHKKSELLYLFLGKDASTVVDFLILSDATPGDWNITWSLMILDDLVTDLDRHPGKWINFERFLYSMPTGYVQRIKDMAIFAIDGLYRLLSIDQLAPTLLSYTNRGVQIIRHVHRLGWFDSYMARTCVTDHVPIVFIRDCPEIDMVGFLLKQQESSMWECLCGIGKSLMQTTRTPDYLIELIDAMRRRDPARAPSLGQIRSLGVAFLSFGNAVEKWLTHWYRALGPAPYQDLFQLIYDASKIDGASDPLYTSARVSTMRRLFVHMLATSDAPITHVVDIKTFMVLLDDSARRALSSIPELVPPSRRKNTYIDSLCHLPGLLQQIRIDAVTYTHVQHRMIELYYMPPGKIPTIEATVLEQLAGITKNANIAVCTLNALYHYTHRQCDAVVAYLSTLDPSTLSFTRRDITTLIQNFSSYM